MSFQISYRLRHAACGAILAAAWLSGCQSKNADKDSLIYQPPPIIISESNANTTEPALATDASGYIYSIYTAHNTDKSADIYLQKFDADGNAVGKEVRVNSEKGQAKTWFGDPPTIQIGKDDAVYIGWTVQAANKEKSGANILYLSVSRDGGASFAAPVKVNDDIAPAAHGMHSLAIGGDNSIYLAWLDERNLKTEAFADNSANENQSATEAGFQFVKAHHTSNQNNATKVEQPAAKEEEIEPNSEVFYAVSRDGGKTFAPNRKLASEVCPCCKTHLLAAPDGKVYVSWRQVLPGDYRHIAVSALTDQGKSFSAPVIVSDDRWQISACPVSGAPMAMSGNTLEIAWFTAGSAGKQGIYWTTSNDGGATFAPRVLVSENAASGTPALFNETGATRIVWAEAGKIFEAPLGNETSFETSRREIGTGELPAATRNRKRVYVASVKKDAEQRSVWLTSAKRLFQ